MPVIDVERTGKNIHTMMIERGICVKDVQKKCGFGSPSVIYRWFRGESIPGIDSIVIIADMMHVPIDDIIQTRRV